MPGTVTPLRPVYEPRRGHQCVCGAYWSPGFSSDPAWLLTASRELSFFVGVLSCKCCGRDKLEVLREQAEAQRAAQPPAIVVQREERQPATVTALSSRRAGAVTE